VRLRVARAHGCPPVQPYGKSASRQVEMLLSVDWDYYSGSADLVFDSPLWGSRDTGFDRGAAWNARVTKRGGSSFEALRQDFPLLGDFNDFERLAGVPCYATVSHADAYGLLERIGCDRVLNLDSHHDLFSLSGDPRRVRPGNWAGRALEDGLISAYTCLYPLWHAGVRVAEGFDLTRTRSELPPRFAHFNLELRRETPTLERSDIAAVLLVQSPAWTNPLYDADFLALCQKLKAEFITPPLKRQFT
jgi:hypothetical protein